MKKLLFVFGIMSVLAFSSCSKDKTCTCTSTMNGTVVASQEAKITDGECSDSNSESTISGITTSTKCVEK